MLHLPLSEADRLACTVRRPPDGHVAVFDLVELLLRRLGATVARAELDTGGDGLAAALVVRVRRAELALRGRPADVIALARRARAPLLASDRIPGEAVLILDEERAQIVQQWVEEVQPADFADPVRRQLRALRRWGAMTTAETSALPMSKRRRPGLQTAGPGLPGGAARVTSDGGVEVPATGAPSRRRPTGPLAAAPAVSGARSADDEVHPVTTRRLE